jgi:hypothetical protein
MLIVGTKRVRYWLFMRKDQILYPKTEEVIFKGGFDFDAPPNMASSSINSMYRRALHDRNRGIYLYHAECREMMDLISSRHPEGCFDMIFADPPYFLSKRANGVSQQRRLG